MTWHANNSKPSTSSRELAAESLPTFCLDTYLSGLVKSSNTLAKPCSQGSETESYQSSQYGTTFAPSTESLGADSLTSSLAGFHAKTLAPQGRALALMASEAAYGERWHESFAKYDRDLHLWKTPQCSLLEDYIEFSETWPKWGMMRNGACSERVTPEHHTSGIESGFSQNWPTPLTRDWKDTINGKAPPSRQKASEQTLGQRVSARAGGQSTPRTWPTPTAAEATKIGAQANYGQVGLNNHPAIRGFPSRPKGEKSRAGGQSTPRTYITPRVGGEESMESVAKRKGQAAAERHNTLASVEAQHGKQAGQLNPAWVEWLMGWPAGWTDLKPLETDKFRNVQQWHLIFSVNKQQEGVGSE